MSRSMRSRRVWQSLGMVSLAVLIGLSWYWVGAGVIEDRAIAQSPRIKTDEVWRQIYQAVPDLPLENTYLSKATGKPAPDNTLVGRFISYHRFIKQRSLIYRLDWKLSLADYLGVNEPIDDLTYPGRNTLRKNPVEADVQAIRRLTRQQRENLVTALVSAFAPRSRPSPSLPTPTPTSSPTPIPSPSAPPVRGPGAADLLR